MTGRIFRASAAVAMTAIVLCFIFFVGVLYQHFETQNENQLADQAAYVARGVEMDGQTYLDGLNAGTSRITWVAADGTVLYDSRVDASTLENHASRPEIKQALTNDTGTSVRYSSTLSERTINYAMRLSDGTVLRVSDTRASVLALLVGMLPPLAGVTLIALTLSLFMAYGASKRIVKPLGELDLDHPENAEAYDELTPFLERIVAQNRKIEEQMSQLRRQREEFETITDNMEEGFIVVDKNETVLSHNKSALRLLGAPRGSRADGSEALTLNRSEAFRTAVEDALKGKSTQRMMKSNGRFCQVFAAPAMSENVVKGAIIVLMDVTEKEQREQLRREFAANVSHELKTPLTAISGIAEIMKDGMVKPGDVAHFSGNIYDEAQRLIALVEDIIRLSRLDDGDAGMEKSDVDMLAAARASCESLSHAAGARGIAMTVGGSGGCVYGVRPVLEEMVFNLCDNAVKYNVDGGKVNVSVDTSGGHTVLRVSDTGIGIPKEAQERVFERFYRVDKSHSKAIGGTGLGLSIVKHGAELHGAEVTLESAPGKGTSVTVRF
ncbi:MAG: ATP-binding protein [Oscillospiraceae bacterium]|nr:ATP-binding protein [Oscillospiraceae bacterium]